MKSNRRLIIGYLLSVFLLDAVAQTKIPAIKGATLSVVRAKEWASEFHGVQTTVEAEPEEDLLVVRLRPAKGQPDPVIVQPELLSADGVKYNASMAMMAIGLSNPTTSAPTEWAFRVPKGTKAKALLATINGQFLEIQLPREQVKVTTK